MFLAPEMLHFSFQNEFLDKILTFGTVCNQKVQKMTGATDQRQGAKKAAGQMLVTILFASPTGKLTTLNLLIS